MDYIFLEDDSLFHDDNTKIYRARIVQIFFPRIGGLIYTL